MLQLVNDCLRHGSIDSSERQSCITDHCITALTFTALSNRVSSSHLLVVIITMSNDLPEMSEIRNDIDHFSRYHSIHLIERHPLLERHTEHRIQFERMTAPHPLSAPDLLESLPEGTCSPVTLVSPVVLVHLGTQVLLEQVVGEQMCRTSDMKVTQSCANRTTHQIHVIPLVLRYGIEIVVCDFIH